MRHRISRCTCLATVAIVLCTFSLAAAQTRRPTLRLSGGAVFKVRSPVVAAAATQCNSASAFRSAPGNARRTPSVARPRFFPYFYPIYPSPLNYGYRPSYYPIYPSYEPIEEEEKSLSLRVSTYSDKKRAGELIDRGDASFARRQYVPAISRYKEAIRVAPDVAESRLRLALALIAQRKYPAAVAALFETLEVRADWYDSNLHLDQLYAPGELAKTTKVLTRLAESDPMNPELALALGVQLFFSGQREKAEMYFTRAAQLGADKDDRLSAFGPLGEVAQAAN